MIVIPPTANLLVLIQAASMLFATTDHDQRLGRRKKLLGLRFRDHYPFPFRRRGLAMFILTPAYGHSVGFPQSAYVAQPHTDSCESLANRMRSGSVAPARRCPICP